ncbi:MAG TPA: tetratricopeptide repeat protein [Thermoanaerobaculia bacterium]|nr:tetratricopeptide repeat protein [Thermoanaerobaculia bacterium]
MRRVVIWLGLACAAVLALEIVQAQNSRSARRFLPSRPRDPRILQSQQLIERREFGAAAELLTPYVASNPQDIDAAVQLGWCRYRLGLFSEAQETFSGALKAHPLADDARVGLGYAVLQLEGGDAAAKHFRAVLQRDGNHQDALEGMILAGRRSGVSTRLAAESLQASKRLASLSKTIRPELLPTAVERRVRPPVPDSVPLLAIARAVKDYIEINENGVWKPIFVQGFNLGVALPGKFSSEFPTDEALYSRWFEMIASMGSNTIRLYTLLPPEFYRALKSYNDSHPAGRLWLMQGVWTELPDKHDFSNEAYLREFHAETARVIDAVHGNLVLGPKPGHAYGVYNADASASVLGYIVGREWEPFAVADFNALHPNVTEFRGKWLEVSGGRAMECWVASVCDYAAEYEASRYRTIRPLTFANWPTLDPLPHPTESTRAEENAWRERLGLPVKESKTAVWEDDAVTLDATLIRPTPAMIAGFFAAYHIYPNFPDFMNVDPQYETSRDSEGPNRYFGYLQALKQYHGDQPVLVAEFGMSTSRGVAHVHPEGWNHGGVNEREQGVIVARMLRNIHDARYAGGIIFEFMDEWFKSTWSVSPFQSPSGRRQMWFDPEGPEESYGIVATRPDRVRITLDGATIDWSSVRVLSAR